MVPAALAAGAVWVAEAVGGRLVVAAGVAGAAVSWVVAEEAVGLANAGGVLAAGGVVVGAVGVGVGAVGVVAGGATGVYVSLPDGCPGA